MVCAFSFCIYNPPNGLYYTGLLENIELIQKHFPDAYTFVYIGNDVPDTFVIELRARKNVILRFTKETGARNMIHRFFAIDEPEVDIMFVRDADSRVHWKDRWAIREFLKDPTAKVHIIRDNPEHATAIMGGLWGMKKIEGMSIRALYDEHIKRDTAGHGMGVDQDFLIDCVYPKITSVMLIHSSQTWRYRPFETIIPFPFTYTNDIYCGRIEGPSYRETDVPYIETPVTSRPQTVVGLLNRGGRLTRLY
jgi:hypothetical protein